MFQSTTAESIGHSGTHDKKPWRLAFEPDVRLSTTDNHWETRVTEWSPRPEFDRPPVNPVLLAFREFVTDNAADIKDIAVEWLAWFDTLPREGSDSFSFYWEAVIRSNRDEIAFTVRVLSLLVAVAG